MDPFDPFGRCEPMPVWASYRPANARGFTGPAYALGVAHANAGGQDSATGVQPIPPDNAGTTALDTAGVVYDGTPNAAFSSIVTALVSRNLIDVLRTKPVVLQSEAYIRAKHVSGTNNFVYTFFADLGAADDLLEGVPPVTVPLAWDTMTFVGSQKGKLVAVTDLAELFSPYELYAQAAEKLAWNAIDTAEIQAVALLTGANKGVVVDFVGPPASATVEARIITTVVTLKKAEVPPYPDGTYRGYVSPADAAAIMSSVAANSWYDTNKYTDATPILNGEIGTFRGVRFMESNRIPDGKSIIAGPGFMAWGDYQTIQAYRVGPGGNHADPLAQRGLIGWKGMWGMTLIGFDGTPAAGPATNAAGYRFAQVDLTP